MIRRGLVTRKVGEMEIRRRAHQLKKIIIEYIYDGIRSNRVLDNRRIQVEVVDGIMFVVQVRMASSR